MCERNPHNMDEQREADSPAPVLDMDPKDIFMSCDRRNQGAVPVANLIAFITPFLRGDMHALGELQKSLDPNNANPRVDIDTFCKDMSEWTLKMSSVREKPSLIQQMRAGDRCLKEMLDRFKVGLTSVNEQQDRLRSAVENKQKQDAQMISELKEQVVKLKMANAQLQQELERKNNEAPGQHNQPLRDISETPIINTDESTPGDHLQTTLEEMPPEAGCSSDNLEKLKATVSELRQSLEDAQRRLTQQVKKAADLAKLHVGLGLDFSREEDDSAKWRQRCQGSIEHIDEFKATMCRIQQYLAWKERNRGQLTVDNAALTEAGDRKDAELEQLIESNRLLTIRHEELLQENGEIWRSVTSEILKRAHAKLRKKHTVLCERVSKLRQRLAERVARIHNLANTIPDLLCDERIPLERVTQSTIDVWKQTSIVDFDGDLQPERPTRMEILPDPLQEEMWQIGYKINQTILLLSHMTRFMDRQMPKKDEFTQTDLEHPLNLYKMGDISGDIMAETFATLVQNYTADKDLLHQCFHAQKVALDQTERLLKEDVSALNLYLEENSANLNVSNYIDNIVQLYKDVSKSAVQYGSLRQQTELTAVAEMIVNYVATLRQQIDSLAQQPRPTISGLKNKVGDFEPVASTSKASEVERDHLQTTPEEMPPEAGCSSYMFEELKVTESELRQSLEDVMRRLKREVKKMADFSEAHIRLAHDLLGQKDGTAKLRDRYDHSAALIAEHKETVLQMENQLAEVEEDRQRLKHHYAALRETTDRRNSEIVRFIEKNSELTMLNDELLQENDELRENTSDQRLEMRNAALNSKNTVLLQEREELRHQIADHVQTEERYRNTMRDMLCDLRVRLERALQSTIDVWKQTLENSGSGAIFGDEVDPRSPSYKEVLPDLLLEDMYQLGHQMHLTRVLLRHLTRFMNLQRSDEFTQTERTQEHPLNLYKMGDISSTIMAETFATLVHNYTVDKDLLHQRFHDQKVQLDQIEQSLGEAVSELTTYLEENAANLNVSKYTNSIVQLCKYMSKSAVQYGSLRQQTELTTAAEMMINYAATLRQEIDSLAQQPEPTIGP